MSEGMTDRDEQVFEAVGGDPDTVVNEDGVEYVRREEYEALREEFETFRQDVITFMNETQAELRHLKDGDVKTQYPTVIDKFTAMFEDDVETFDSQQSIRRAIEIHRNWDDWKQSLGIPQLDREGISTANKSSRKYSPAQIKIDLNESSIPADDLSMKQVHRAMSMLAKKSYRDDESEITVEHQPKATVRKRVSGGLYRYEHRTSPDASDSSEKHVLVKEE